eukprot:TRINITY_DN62452_c0_g1_i1.p1 TRINITY_DN62452_c0_g1~~TRINITY_DN62452_c0_g1_i1.p1  ORF type:complete len:719 (-),score=107.26 TRINITY_DN62452_c0_g1_i1:90-2207(-)
MAAAEIPKRCRFPPEPSGYLHIGHVKALFLNYTETPDNLLLRMDDTNPAKETSEFVDNIIEDIKSLGVTWKEFSHSSDHFATLLTYADKIIEKGLAYCDDTPKEVMQQQRMDGLPSKNRDNTVEQNKAAWEKMKSGEAVDTCLRAKISVDCLNKAMRDPVIYRVNLTPHLKTGDKFKVYPTYDFTCPILDSIEGVTDALRTSEYNDRNDQYYWICDALELRKPTIRDFSRLNLEYTIMSKRKLTELVNKGMVRGWDDPRFPTVKGLLRRGVQPEALKKFVTQGGFSKVINVMEWSKFWNMNKNEIDNNCPRYNCVDSFRVKCTIEGAPDTVEQKEVPLHKKNADLGARNIMYSKNIFLEEQDVLLLKEGEEITLMEWGNAIIEKINKDGDKVVDVQAKLHLEGDFKKTKWKLHWVADTPDVVPITLYEFDHLLTVRSLDKGTDIDPLLNKETEFKLEAIAEAAIRNVKPGDIIQFQRRGYFRCDSLEPNPQFFNFPDGNQKINHLSALKRFGNKEVETLEKKRERAAEAKKKQVAGGKAKTAAVLLPDLRVGKIVDVKKHPDAEALYVESIDLGEGEPRTIVSGLVKWMPAEALQDKLVLVMCNLKPAPLRGVMSSGMVLCASTDSALETVPVPEGSSPGDRVAFPAELGEIPAEIPKKKVPKVLEGMKTDDKGVCSFMDADGKAYPFALPKGNCTSQFPDVPVK